MIKLGIQQLTEVEFPFVSQFFADVLNFHLDDKFHPHEFDESSAWTICHHVGKDWYAGGFAELQEGSVMAGYVMLRGWDAGYVVPSFGVCVLPRFQGIGVGRTLLRKAVEVAIQRGAPAVRLKVYPDNTVAIGLYGHEGFQFQDRLENGQLVGYLSLCKENLAGPSPLEYMESDNRWINRYL